jgi:pimeloyl-ACP methyl ester carboxylesterase
MVASVSGPAKEENLSNRLPGARHLELPWAGRLPSMERPDELNPVLLDFLNGTLTTR